MRSAKEAVAYMKKVHTLVRYLGICDGNMQEGSFRCDANVSVRRVGAAKFGTRAELKNLNSFRFVEKAINHEVERQIEILEAGGTIVQETRLYDSDKDETRSMRSKEEANDYRYFPDPDLLPVVLEESFIESVRATLPELPDAKATRFQQQYGLSAYDAQVLTASAEMADYYETVAARVGKDPKLVANWVMGELSGALNRDGIEIGQSRLSADRLAGLVAAHRRRHDLRQDREGSLRDDVDRRQRCRRGHRGEGPASDHRRRGDRQAHRRHHGSEPEAARRLPAPARTSCSASSSARR